MKKITQKNLTKVMYWYAVIYNVVLGELAQLWY